MEPKNGKKFFYTLINYLSHIYIFVILDKNKLIVET